jgi:hypothetical protein
MNSEEKYTCVAYNVSFLSSEEFNVHAKHFHKTNPDKSFV